MRLHDLQKTLAAFLVLGSFPTIAAAAAPDEPDGVCSPDEQAALRCFQIPSGFVVEVVPGPGGEFPVINDEGDSVFAYKISGPGSTGGSCRRVYDVSHANIQLPVCVDPRLSIVAASPEPELLTGGHGDPSCGFGAGDLEHDLLKWDSGVRCDEMRVFSVTLAGTVGAEAREFFIKAGQDCESGRILGPGCPADEQFCLGDEGCPCDNPSETGGCATSSGVGGTLTRAGTLSVSADDLLIAGEGLPIEQFTVLFMGAGAKSDPGTIGDGRRCISGPIFRFRKASTGPLGRVIYGPGLVETSCTSFPPAGCITAGSTWYFQLWFRDPDGPCFSGFNTTNALELTFTP